MTNTQACLLPDRPAATLAHSVVLWSRMLFALGPLRRCSRLTIGDMRLAGNVIRFTHASSVSWARACSHRELRTRLSESRPLRARCWSVATDGHRAPPMCRTAMLPVCKMLGLSLGIWMALSTMVPLGRQEAAGLRRAQGTKCDRSSDLGRRPHASDRVRIRTCTKSLCGWSAWSQGWSQLKR